jgi:uncharacterized protein YjiS (DUF1127 family)
MKTSRIPVAAALLIGQAFSAAPGPSDMPPSQTSKNDVAAASAASIETESASRADKRYEEMLDKMQAAVEEIAQLYGNPVFLQVFTNDVERATELKQRLRAARSDEEIRRELAEMEKKRDDLLNDIALKEREAANLASRLVRQRVALDTLAVAVEQARKAVEESSK